ncbi:hypothetical protein, partial [Luedemannella flava]|uniref:hypothetical protein n=1 Tax=Luedemannella flava TaxID=349316 RepID=UPI0031D2E9F2
MSEQSERWSEVGAQMEALAQKVKLHFEQSGGRAEEAQDVLQKVRNAVGDAFEASGNAVRDDAVRNDVKETGRLFVEALSATFAKVSDALKELAEAMRERARPADQPDEPAA